MLELHSLLESNYKPALGSEFALLAKTRLTISELPFTSKICLRGRCEDEQFSGVVKQILACELPLMGKATVIDDYSLCCLGPEEWLMFVPASHREDILMKLKQALGNTFAAVIDLSSAWTTFALAGEGAGTVLSTACELDFHDSQFLKGDCLRTKLGSYTAIVYKSTDDPLYEVSVNRSHSLSFLSWLEDAACKLDNL